MGKRKTTDQKPDFQILETLKPVINYLLDIQHKPISEDKSSFIYTMAFPHKWVLKSNLVEFNIVRTTENLVIVEVLPFDYETDVDKIYSHIIEIINKNIKIDEKRIEYQNQIDNLKIRFENEQKQLLEGLFENQNTNYDDSITEMEDDV